MPAGEGRDLAMLRTARLQAMQGRLDPALETLHELQADTSADGERIRDAYLLESELLDGATRSDEALAAIERGLGIFEADPVLLYARAMVHERADRVDAALADLRRIIDDNPRDAHALNAYGYTLAERRRDYAAALPFVRRAHAIEPESAPILDSLGWIELRLGREDSALALPAQGLGAAQGRGDRRPPGRGAVAGRPAGRGPRRVAGRPRHRPRQPRAAQALENYTP